MLSFHLLFWISLGLVHASSSLRVQCSAPEPIQFLSLRLAFKIAFSRKCSFLGENSPISGNCAVMECAEEVSQAGFLGGMGRNEAYFFLFNDWYQCLRIEELVEEARNLRKLPEAHQLRLKRQAKELTVFLTQLTIFTGRSYRPDSLVIALEFIIRAAPLTKFYYELVRKTLPSLQTEDQEQLLAVLLDVFDVNESRFFQVIVKDKMFDFFEAWYEKLNECDFEGTKVQLHLAQLTASLMASELEWDEEFLSLLQRCLQRVCFPLLMAIESEQHRYPSVISALPTEMKTQLLDRMLTDEVIASVTESQAIIYALIFKSLCLKEGKEHRAAKYQQLSAISHSKLKSIMTRVQFVTFHILPELNYFSELLQNTPIVEWDGAKVIRAAALYKLISDNFKALTESGITDTSTRIWQFSRVLEQFTTGGFNFTGTAEQIVGRAQLIIVLLGVQVNLLHATNDYGKQAIKLLKLLKWEDPQLSKLIRQYYPSAMTCLLFLCRNGLIENNPESIKTITQTVLNCSETPALDLDFLIHELLSKNFGYFEAVFRGLEGRNLGILLTVLLKWRLVYPFLSPKDQDQWQLAISLMIREQKALQIGQICLLNSLKEDL